MGETNAGNTTSGGPTPRAYRMGTVSALEFDAWLGTTPAAAALLAPDGRLLGANAEFRSVVGVEAPIEITGSHLREIAPDLWVRLAPLVRWAALTGARAADLAIRSDDNHAPGGSRQWLVRLAPSHVAGSRELRLLVLDVTDADLDKQTPATPAEAEAAAAPALDLRVPAQPGELTGLRRQLTGWLETLGATQEEQSDIVLAAHEAAANAIQHGADERHEFRVAAVASHGCVVVRVDDSGHWAPPEGKEPDRGAGHGLAMMQLLMDDVAVHPDGDGTHVRMQRQLASRVGSTA